MKSDSSDEDEHDRKALISFGNVKVAGDFKKFQEWQTSGESVLRKSSEQVF